MGAKWLKAAGVLANGVRQAGETQFMTAKLEPKVGVAELGDKGRGEGRSMWISLPQQILLPAP